MRLGISFRKQTRRLISNCPRSSLDANLWSKGGHWPMIEVPDDLKKDIVGFTKLIWKKETAHEELWAIWSVKLNSYEWRLNFVSSMSTTVMNIGNQWYSGYCKLFDCVPDLHNVRIISFTDYHIPHMLGIFLKPPPSAATSVSNNDIRHIPCPPLWEILAQFRRPWYTELYIEITARCPQSIDMKDSTKSVKLSLW